MAPYASSSATVDSSPVLTLVTKDSPASPRLLAAPPSTMPSTTAAAVAALIMAEQHGAGLDVDVSLSDSMLDAAYHGDLSEQLVLGLKHLARTQNADGGWSAAPGEASCTEESLAVLAAFQLCGVPACYGDVGAKLEEYLRTQGGLAKLVRSYSGDAIPLAQRLLIAQLAAADRVPWRPVGARPLDQLIDRLRTLSTADEGVAWSESAAWLAAGMAQARAAGSRNPLRRWRDARSIPQALALLQDVQLPGGSFGNLVRPTAQVVLLLTAAGHGSSRVVRRGVSYLLHAAHGDGTWSASCLPPALPRRAK